MKKLILLFCIALSFTALSKAQNKEASIYLSADTAVNVSIKNHVDGAFQSRLIWDNFEIGPSHAVKYLMDLEDYSFIQFDFGGIWCFAIACEGDSIALHFANDTIFQGGYLPENYSDILFHFEGANAAGQKYYNNHWLGSIEFTSQLQAYIAESDDFSDFEERFVEKFALPIQYDIDSMAQAALITPEFGEVLRREILDYEYNELLSSMKVIPQKKKMTDQQTNHVNAIIDRITDKFAKYEDDNIALKYRLGASYINDKYYNMYSKLSNAQKKELYGKHKPKAFGPQAFLLSAPKEVQLAFLFSAILTEYEFGHMGFGPIDIPYLIDYMRTLAPKSEAVEILTKLEKDRMAR